MKRILADFLFVLTILLIISPVTSLAEGEREGYWEMIDVRHEMNIKYKRDRMKQEANKGNEYAEKISREYNEMLKNVEWNGGRLSPHLEEKFKKLNELYKKFMRGEVGHEGETIDELSRMESETSLERLQRNLGQWKKNSKDMVKNGTLDTIEEVARGNTAKSTMFKVLMGTLTGGYSEFVLTPTESFYTMKDTIAEGKGAKEAVTKVYKDLAIDQLTGKAADKIFSSLKGGK